MSIQEQSSTETVPASGSRKGYLVGSGIASLAAACYLIKEGGLAGRDITLFEETRDYGGRGDGSRLLRVNAPQTFTMRWLIPRLSSFAALHPKIEVRLSASIAPVETITEPFDIAIRRGPIGTTSSSFSCRRLSFQSLARTSSRIDPFMRSAI